MFDWLRSLFGEGKIRCLFQTEDGQTGHAKVPYTGSLDTITELELLEQVCAILRTEQGIKIKRIRIDSCYGTSGGEPDWSYKWYKMST